MSATSTPAPEGRLGWPFLLADSARFLELIWRPGEVREVRISQHNQWGHTASGYFDCPERLLKGVPDLDGKANIYVTLDPVNPALLARAANRIIPKATGATAGADIVSRRFLFLDIDSVRPSGISASDAELESAWTLTATVSAALTACGFQEPRADADGSTREGAMIHMTERIPACRKRPSLPVKWRGRRKGRMA